MALRRITHARARSGKIRPNYWVASATDTDITNLAAATAQQDQTGTVVDIEGGTVVRTRGIFSVGSDQSAANEFPFGAVGFTIVSEEAAGIGVTAVPTPYADADDDRFFVHFFWAAGLRVATAVGFQTGVLEHFPFDSKAQRKITASDVVSVTVENASATDGALYVINFRELIKG